MNERAALRRTLCATLLACSVNAAAAPAPAPMLEDAFWACDFIATTRGMAAAPEETCVAVYEEVKATKFDGDFDALVAWWQANKAEAHERIAGMVVATPQTATVAVAAPPADVVPSKPTRRARLLAATRVYFESLASVFRAE